MTSARHFDAWWKRQRHQTPDLLTLTLDDLLSAEAAEALELDSPPTPRSGPRRHPAAAAAGQRALSLSYAFEPGTETDGVTIDIPLSTLNQARPEEFSWQVPGLRHELVTELIRSLPKALRRELVPAPDVAREVLARLDGTTPAGDIRDVLSRELLRLRGVRVPPDAFDLDKLPAHLRITFRIVDDGRVLATGKDLAALQRQLRPKLRATLSARASALTRTGLTTWDIGPLPQVFTDGEVKAYPALVDNGDTVDVRLFETPETARAAMLAGTRRLILLGARSPVKDIAARLTTAQKLALSNNPHGGVAALFADAVNCAADGLIADAGGPAWDAAGFERLAADVRPRLHAATHEVITWAEEILRAAHAAQIRLGELRSPVLEPAAADIRAQLDGLVYPGFLAATGTRRLPALARYLRAIQYRLDKLPDNPGRDAQQMAVAHRVEDAYRDALAALPAAERSTEAAREIGWQIQELRVSLFAQTIGTQGPVSERRILTAIDHLT